MRHKITKSKTPEHATHPLTNYILPPSNTDKWLPPLLGARPTQLPSLLIDQLLQRLDQLVVVNIVVPVRDPVRASANCSPVKPIQQPPGGIVALCYTLSADP